jgi:hypothetical protein
LANTPNKCQYRLAILKIPFAPKLRLHILSGLSTSLWMWTLQLLREHVIKNKFKKFITITFYSTHLEINEEV